MRYDGDIIIATGASAHTKIWKNKEVKWSELVQMLSHERRTSETRREFLAMPKSEQLSIKDVGGYVGGYLRGGRRKPENVVNRQLLTLDVDFAYNDLWDDITLLYNNACVLHATHKHCEDSPRYRLVMPLSRKVTADEYIAISRKIAGTIGIDLFDNTTFETNRLMFWPSNPADIDYYFKVQDGAFLDADAVLATYEDWRDSSLWPTNGSRDRVLKSKADKQEDPELKKGIVGAFCRSYSISEAIEKYLSKVYEPAGEDRYTYLNGTAACGLVVYDDKFAYSHHGTDPASGKLCNSFDLVRIHRYGHLDTDNSGKKSFKAMNEAAREDDKVKGVIAEEHYKEIQQDFEEVVEDPDPEDIEWMKELKPDKQGDGYAASSKNIDLILKNDMRLQNIFRRNLFDYKAYVVGTLPWRRVEEPEPLRNVDYAGVRNYIENSYGIAARQKIEDALELEIERNSFHPVRDYLRSLKWDGVKRIDTLLPDYFGAKDNLYVREVTRKTLCGAIARVLHPGAKFDYVLTLLSKQGCMKSTFVKKLGRQWSSDSFITVEGTRAFEQIQGVWVMEIAELAGMKKAEVESTKHFITKREDSFRPAYGRTVETFKRQGIFIATGNERNFLKDPTGGRRFWPVDLNPEKRTKDVFKDLTEDEIDQIWAEALEVYRAGETLYLTGEAEKLAYFEQKSHSEVDERVGIIERYLETPLPANWDKLDLFDRRLYYEDDTEKQGVQRTEVCVAEIWCECLDKERQDMDRYKTREINNIMKGFDNWEPSEGTKKFSQYGTQRYYKRI